MSDHPERACTEPTQHLRVEAGTGRNRDEDNVMVEYLGVQVIIARRTVTGRDPGVYVLIAGDERHLDLEVNGEIAAWGDALIEVTPNGAS